VTGAWATRTAVAFCCNGNVAVCCGNRAVAVCCGRALWLSAVPHHDDCLLSQHCGQNYVAVCCLYTPRDTRESLPAGFLPPLSAPFLSLYPSSLSLQIIGTDETSIWKVNGHIFAKRLQFIQSILSTRYPKIILHTMKADVSSFRTETKWVWLKRPVKLHPQKLVFGNSSLTTTCHLSLSDYLNILLLYMYKLAQEVVLYSIN
jgi:hypothetical protein